MIDSESEKSRYRYDGDYSRTGLQYRCLDLAAPNHAHTDADYEKDVGVNVWQHLEQSPANCESLAAGARFCGT